MRVIVLGGTRFIGRATVEELVAAGHEVMVVHRGRLEHPAVDDQQLVPGGSQLLDGRAADEPRAAEHDDLHLVAAAAVTT